jgi:NOL1/NOP2/fmu family ribosome biogenesis protein
LTNCIRKFRVNGGKQMNIKFIKSPEKKRIVKELEETYGIKELNYLLIETGKRKLRAYSGDLSKEEILELGNTINIEIIGMYLLSQKDADLRINFDAVSLLRDQIEKNIVKINQEQYELWMRGYDLEIKHPRGIAVIKFKHDLVGIGRSNGEKIFNYVPKERKLKTPLPKTN